MPNSPLRESTFLLSGVAHADLLHRFLPITSAAVRMRRPLPRVAEAEATGVRLARRLMKALRSIMLVAYLK